ncbi:MAG: DegT/DnrJ/EryC1/StrS aminotransferase family protein [Myxococcota bacterium]|nr:DegT/DnrJ/EryC1/StrS aminotransferase family protein [Myxococcota bacterium]
MTINIPLMSNNIIETDRAAVIEFLQGDPILTQSSKVREFEAAWSKWLGVKHSLFINSGSSANLLTIAAFRHLYGEGEIIVPPLTWVSDISACLHTQMKPVFVDITPKTLAMNPRSVLDAITNNTKAVFLTHILGLNGLSTELLEGLKERNIPLIEDVCESHGATFQGKRLGSYGKVSNFSYYYAHHMSTIEGGMICTNDDDIYEVVRMLRSHGMVREASREETKNHYKTAYPDLNPDFIFTYPAFNTRSTEMNAVIGLSQLPRLDANNELRTRNFKLFLDNLDSEKYFTDFDIEGSVNYAFILVLRNKDQALWDRLSTALREAKVEFRRGTSGGGNQLRQPYLRDRFPEKYYEKFVETDHVHFYGCYIGNYPTLETDKILQLCKLLNQL